MESTTEDFEALVGAALHINAALDLESMGRAVLEEACRVLDTEAASLMLVDQGSGGLKWLAALGEAGPVIVNQDLQAGEGIAGWVAMAGETVVSNDAANDPRFCQRIDALSGFVTRSILCVPMVARGRILGVLELLNRSENRPFEAHDVRKAQAFSSLAAIALDHAQLLLVAEEAGNVREISRFKADMVSVVSHELRNPLTTIRGFAEMCAHHENVSLDDTRRFSGLIHDEAMRMERLIDDFLNLSGVESGALPVREASVPLQPALEAAVERQSGTRETHPITMSGGADAVVHADPDRIHQVLDNLLNNAVKYSPDGGAISVEAEMRGGVWRIWVRDRGLGIPRDSLPRLFHHFYRVPAPRHAHLPGTGLGLTVVKVLVERM
ncbi:MAG: GAF domain-containing protein, partial [Armatimonadetes bacterium]|nr:GAF domain-containing protein [Armatimonadota bacterium]